MWSKAGEMRDVNVSVLSLYLSLSRYTLWATNSRACELHVFRLLFGSVEEGQRERSIGDYYRIASLGANAVIGGYCDYNRTREASSV